MLTEALINGRIYARIWFAFACVLVILLLIHRFSTWQCCLLAVVIASVYSTFRDLRKIAEFTPYVLRFGLDLPGILSAVGLPTSLHADPRGVLDPEKTKFFEHFSGDPELSTQIQWTWYEVLVLQPSLFLTPENNRYGSSIGIWEEVDAVRIFKTFDFTPSFFLSAHPRLRLRASSFDGSLMMMLDSEWLAEAKRLGIVSSLVESSYHGELTLGVLPLRYLTEHIRDYEMSRSLFTPWRLIQWAWLKKLRRLGWTTENDKGMPSTINHRFLSVQFQSL